MNNEIGTIGQKYENRKTKKSGVLIRREYNDNFLVFQSNNGEEFTVGVGTFKSNWRKVADTEPVVENVSKPVTEPTEVVETVNEPESVTAPVEVENEDVEAVVTDFLSHLETTNKYSVAVENGVAKITLVQEYFDGVVMTVQNTGNCQYLIKCISEINILTGNAVFKSDGATIDHKWSKDLLHTEITLNNVSLAEKLNTIFKPAFEKLRVFVADYFENRKNDNHEEGENE